MVAAATLAACTDAPTIIDGTTPKQFEETTRKARRDLPIRERLLFDAALHNPGGRRFATKDAKALARESYHGMTAFDVVADARARGVE